MITEPTPEDMAREIKSLSMKFFAAAAQTDGGTETVFKYPVTAVKEMIESALATAREQALEEAAKVAGSHYLTATGIRMTGAGTATAEAIEHAIRALIAKGKP